MLIRDVAYEILRAHGMTTIFGRLLGLSRPGANQAGRRSAAVCGAARLGVRRGHRRPGCSTMQPRSPSSWMSRHGRRRRCSGYRSRTGTRFSVVCCPPASPARTSAGRT